MSNSLEKTKVAFEQWRQLREKKGPIPPRLIEQAVALTGQYSKTKITQSLKINSIMLNRWLAQHQATNSFIKLTPPTNPSSPACQSQTAMMMQITLSDGLQLAIHTTTDQAASLILSLRDGATS